MNEEQAVIPVPFDMKNSLSKVWDNSSNILRLDNLASEAKLISTNCLALATQSNDALKKPLLLSIEETYLHYQVVFEWMDEVKHFMIAWRDVAFQQYKGNVFLYDKKSNKDQLLDFKLQSKISIDKVAFDLVAKLEACQIEPNQITSKVKRELRQQANLKNPYSIYAQQIQDLVQQCQDCNDSIDILEKEQDVFHHIKQLIDENIKQIQIQVKHFESTLQNLVTDLSKSNYPDPKLQLQTVIDAEGQINFDNLQTDFNTKLDELIEQLATKLDVPVSAQVGTMMKREIGLQRQVKRWLQSEMKPLLYEIWEIRDRLTTGGKLIFMNLKNQLNILIAQQENDNNPSSNTVSTALITDTFLHQMSQQIKELTSLSIQIYERLDESFSISNVFDTSKHFLPLPTQASINQLIFKQNDVLTTLKTVWDNQQQKIQQYRLPLEQEKELSISEKVVRYITHKRGSTKNDYYQNIFLTKGYIGEAFWVGREDKIERAAQVIENWKDGFRGAILLTGKRFSGKSLFGEIIVNRHFANRTIHLFPNAKVKIGTQTIKTTYDLGKALNLIKMHTRNKPYCLWVDNIEMWWDVNISASKNIRNLKSFMDRHCNQLFFIIATSDSYKAHISKAQEFDRVFQAEITMGNFPFNDLEKAISIRHGATHKTLINENGLPLSSQQFRKIVKKIHKEANSNIGEALFLWSNAIQNVQGNDVRCKFEANLIFPDILNASTATLLTSIVLQKRTNEYRLHKLFGPAYNQKYASLVKRLLGVGILTKKMDGWLEINELIVHEIIDMLKRKKYLL
jgi:hypothetical protein